MTPHFEALTLEEHNETLEWIQGEILGLWRQTSRHIAAVDLLERTGARTVADVSPDERGIHLRPRTPEFKQQLAEWAASEGKRK